MGWKLKLHPEGPGTFSVFGRTFRQGQVYDVDENVVASTRAIPRIEVWQDDGPISVAPELPEPSTLGEQSPPEEAFVANTHPVSAAEIEETENASNSSSIQPNEVDKYDCDVAGCSRVGAKGFNTIDSLQRHQRAAHKV